MSTILDQCPRCGVRRAPGEVVCPRDATVLVPADVDPMLGTQVGPWRVVRRLGVGGMGAVYEVLEVNIARRAAMKVVHPHFKDEPNLPGLLEEARAATAIHDDGLVDVFGFGTLDDGRTWLVMELLEGESLEQRLLRERRLSVEDTIAVALPILHALEAAHAAGIIHRDLKPANIFLERRADGSARPRLLDLGLAKRITVASPMAVGTPDYVAPEQARNEPVGPRADLYSFGCVLFELLTGQVPFSGPDAQAIVNAHASAPRPRLLAARPDVPPALDALVSSMMQIEQRARPASANAVREALRKLQAPAVVAPAALVPSPSRAPVIAVAAAVLALIVAGLALGLRARTPDVPVAPRVDPVAEAVTRAVADVRGRLDAGVLEGPGSALERLREAKAAWPQRAEWPALSGELASLVRRQAVAALATEDAEAARAQLDVLAQLEARDAALEAQATRMSFAQHNGMVRVGEGYIDRYEHPNRAQAQPTTGVDWADAVALCEQAGKHLCSEQEWERACSGAAHRAFSWGDDAKAVPCVHREKKVKGAGKSGGARGCVTAEGVFDLSGNVAEWTSSPLRDGAPQRVLRGGSFKQSDEKLGCAARDYQLPGLGGAAHVGLRCCL